MSHNEPIVLNKQIEQEVDLAVGEAVEEVREKLANEQTPFKKMYAWVMMLAAILISAGQWNDSMDFFDRLYSSAMANFTHTLEYETISNIHVGNNLSYILNFTGTPQIVKSSQLNPNVTFHYFLKDKYDLTLISQGDRVVGYSILSKVVDFQPEVPFSGILGSKTLQQEFGDIYSHFYDSMNLAYYLELQRTSVQQMFLNVMQGYIEYGALPQNQGLDGEQEINGLIDKIVQAETFSDLNEDTFKAVEKTRSQIYPNFFSVTELTPTIITESLLTRHEYQMYNNS